MSKITSGLDFEQVDWSLPEFVGQTVWVRRRNNHKRYVGWCPNQDGLQWFLEFFTFHLEHQQCSKKVIALFN